MLKDHRKKAHKYLRWTIGEPLVLVPLILFFGDTTWGSGILYIYIFLNVLVCSLLCLIFFTFDSGYVNHVVNEINELKRLNKLEDPENKSLLTTAKFINEFKGDLTYGAWSYAAPPAKYTYLIDTFLCMFLFLIGFPLSGAILFLVTCILFFMREKRAPADIKEWISRYKGYDEEKAS